MKQNKIIKTCFLLLLMFSSLNQIFCQDIPVIRIDPEKAYGGKVSDYFESVEYIPLETTKESLFGDISQLIITENSFVVHDHDTKSVLFFDQKGKFLSKIGQSGNYIPTELFYNKNDQQVLILKENKSKEDFNSRFDLSAYSTKGIFSLDKLKPTEELAQKIFSIDLGNGYSITPCSAADFYNNKIQKPPQIDSFYFFRVFNGKQFDKSLISIDRKENSSYLRLSQKIYKLPSPVINNNHAFYFSTPLTHNIYLVNKDTAIEKYRIVFPSSHQVDNNLFKINNAALIDSICKTRKWIEPNYILSLSNLVLLNNQFIFKTNYDDSRLFDAEGKFICRNLIYHLKSGKLIAIERMTPDKSTAFLPFYDPYTFTVQGLKHHESYFYAHLSSLKMFQAKEKTKFQNPKYPPVLEEYFKTQNRKSNPVIVKMKLK